MYGKIMREQHPNSLEKIGTGLVCSVETFRGCTIQLVKKQSGFNGLSTNKDGDVRKIEVKTMEKSFNWIAISSLTAIDKLFFERDYWLYFVLMPKNFVVMTKGLPFIKLQLSFDENKDFINNLQQWMKATRTLTKGSGLKFLPKLQLKFPMPLDKLVEHLIAVPDDEQWHDSVIEIWQNTGAWKRVYLAPEKD
ncbi:hypothetical protein U14_01443 [Candidatus Moduliflexus flocculans]|uniref:Uncharacterized protein n=1 Tax=Candidatus Moduliflexus flocculans TaxID=1499966 RepID=A0A0S6VS31_9BACT|nr:hypothetical protein U14_01443 [Candidatus Moduliflexus flocculans]